MDKRFFLSAARQTRARTEPIWGQVEGTLPEADCLLLRDGLHSLRYTARRDLTVTVVEEAGYCPILVVERDARDIGKTSCKVEVEYSHDESGRVVLADDLAGVDVLAPDGRRAVADLPVEIVMYALYGVVANCGLEVAMQYGLIPVLWTGRRPIYETRIDESPTGMESSLFFGLGARMLARELGPGQTPDPGDKFDLVPAREEAFVPMVDGWVESEGDSPVEAIDWPPVQL